ncbi:MAG TPA: MFS transporter, partial [Gammaproteobacteria bacterium]|nr:MFS transporter [Gammaproteobacteria bacterium]
AFYYYAYTPMQVPAGMLYDRFGARLVLFFACLTAVVGLGVFITADNFALAALGRFLIGLGTAFSYIGSLKLASIWLPTNRFATAAGLTTAFGMTSAIISQNYLTKVVQVVGYKQALYSVLFLGILLSVIIFFMVRNRPTETIAHRPVHTPMDSKQLFKSLQLIFTNPQMWLIGCVGCLTYLPASVFLDLWGISFLKTAYSLTPEQAAYISSCAFVGWIIAGPTMGALSDKIKRRRVPLLFAGITGTVLLCTIFYVPGLTSAQLSVAFFLLGFCCGSHPICFAIGKENNPIQISGTAVAATNMLTMMGGALFQPLVGKLLDWHASGAIGANGLPIYTTQDYLFALSIVPVGVAIGGFLCFFLKETYCQSQAKEKDIRMFTARKPVSIIDAEPEARSC